MIGIEATAALAWARRNVVAHADAGGTTIELRGGDLADQRLLADLDGTADLVTANPPMSGSHVGGSPRSPITTRPSAVFGGPDGLAVIRPLITVAAGLLKPGGCWPSSMTTPRGTRCRRCWRPRVWTDVVDHQDLTGRPRFVTAAGTLRMLTVATRRCRRRQVQRERMPP